MQERGMEKQNVGFMHDTFTERVSAIKNVPGIHLFPATLWLESVDLG